MWGGPWATSPWPKPSKQINNNQNQTKKLNNKKWILAETFFFSFLNFLWKLKTWGNTLEFGMSANLRRHKIGPNGCRSHIGKMWAKVTISSFGRLFFGKKGPKWPCGLFGRRFWENKGPKWPLRLLAFVCGKNKGPKWPFSFFGRRFWEKGPKWPLRLFAVVFFGKEGAKVTIRSFLLIFLIFEFSFGKCFGGCCALMDTRNPNISLNL